jgi:hypothetical protein
VLENRVLRNIFGQKRGEGKDDRQKCIMRSFMTCTSPNIKIKEDNIGRTGGMCRGKPEGKNRFKDLGIDGTKIKLILNNWNERECSGFMGLRIRGTYRASAKAVMKLSVP